ncbi:hypothetical protein [[Scytonema hofmanni] UTEX B 1581]|uniref:hypothetical protein n=1 Tax=[Scytonema hofmanni] UTEX B 1581 TaxID=379535 RepID=UPI000495698F|nr:hypothetical protein [[Scytonema hofmanni] UTEX B 1581]
MNSASLENLKLGATHRDKGKIRTNVTILPETKAWLERGGNVSGRIDEMVGKILRGELVGCSKLEDAHREIASLKALLEAGRSRVGNDPTTPTA